MEKILKRFLAIALCLVAASASAESPQDNIVQQLRQQGFTRITISRTLLGRQRIVATSKTLTREIIFNPATGAILRDYWEDRSERGGGTELFDPNRDSGGTSSSNLGDADNDDGHSDGDGGDEGEDGSGGEEGHDGGEGDEGDSDNSGSGGGGNSGSGGGGNSGHGGGDDGDGDD